MPRGSIVSLRSSPADARPLPRPRRDATGAAAQTAAAVLVLQQLRELFRVAQQHFQKVQERCGVSGAQLWAMAELQRRPGLTVSELAGVLSVHLSTASNMLVKLETKGHIRRERTVGDQRVVNVYLTAAGRKCLKKAPRPVEGVLPDALNRMPPEALRRLHADLAVLLELSAVRNSRAGLRHLSE